MLRNRNFLMLFTATIISRAGDTFTFLALAYKIDSISLNRPSRPVRWAWF